MSSNPLNVPLQGSYRPRLLPVDFIPPQAPFPLDGGGYGQLPDGRWLELPFLALPDDFTTAIAYLAINQTTFEIEDVLSSAMAAMVRHLQPEVVVGMPTFGMVLAAPVAKKLGHSEYVPLGYSRKFWYQDELSEDVVSITSPGKPKQVFIDPRLLERLAGKRVVLVEDVISTGGTLAGELRLMQRIGANVVGIVTAVKETNVWEKNLGAINPAYPSMVYAPLEFPLYRRTEQGWMPDMGTAPGA